MSPIPIDPAACLADVVELALAAGREVLRIYATPFDVTLKSDRSPLTEADLVSQRTIAAGLAAMHPAIPMLGEESAAEVFERRRGWATLWLVDPLDGTREFIKRNGEFCINIALVHEGTPVLGVVHAPARGVTYAAVRGHGGFRRDAQGREQPLRVVRPAPPTLRVCASRSHGDAVLDRMLDRLGPQQRLSAGSALKFGLLAEGSADLYVRRGPTSEWDTAAGEALVLEAGGRLTDFEGRPLRYNDRPTLINPPFIASADGSRDWPRLLGVQPADGATADGATSGDVARPQPLR